jgi:hypothetical protein
MCVMKLPILVFVAQSVLAATCADLASLHPPDTAITLAQTVEAGAFTPPAVPRAGTHLAHAAGAEGAQRSHMGRSGRLVQVAYV